MGVDCRHQCDHSYIVNNDCVFVFVFLSCDFVRGFEKGKVKIVIELDVLKSDKRKRVG